MRRWTRRLPALVAPVLVTVAILGYLAGHRRAPAAAGERARVAYGANIVLEYPATWKPVRGGAPIPELRVVRPLLIAPGGDSARAGLLSGHLRGDEAGPVPASLLAVLRAAPHTEVVNLLDAEAYRYKRLRLGSGLRLELYVIPNPAGSPTALACYASPQDSSSLAQCEQIVARLNLVGQGRYDLSPDAGYARRLGGLIAALERDRLALRREMRPPRTPAAVAGPAGALADRLGSTAAAIRVLEPPAVAGPAQAALVGSIERARETYRALAGAAAAASPGDMAVAQAHLGEAEAAVDGALETFALLGYNHT
jgi:hypothetical protein